MWQQGVFIYSMKGTVGTGSALIFCGWHQVEMTASRLLPRLELMKLLPCKLVTCHVQLLFWQLSPMFILLRKGILLYSITKFNFHSYFGTSWIKVPLCYSYGQIYVVFSNQDSTMKFCISSFWSKAIVLLGSLTRKSSCLIEVNGLNLWCYSTLKIGDHKLLSTEYLFLYIIPLLLYFVVLEN